MDPAWEFEKRCKEAGDELVGEVLGFVKAGEGIRIAEELFYQVSAGMVPIPTVNLWQLVEYIDEQWDDVDRSGTFDDALRQAVHNKATEYVGEVYYQRLSEEKLEALAEAYDAAALAMVSEEPEKEYKKAASEYAEEFAMLAWEPAWPPTEPSLLRKLALAQEKAEVDDEPDQDPRPAAAPKKAHASILSLSLIRRPGGPR